MWVHFPRASFRGSPASPGAGPPAAAPEVDANEDDDDGDVEGDDDGAQLDFVCLGNRHQCPFGFLATIPHVSYIFRKLMTNGIQWWVVHDILGSLGGH